jgi:hypothetical protein
MEMFVYISTRLPKVNQELGWTTPSWVDDGFQKGT